MSGGHFDYRDSCLGYIAEQLEQDVEFNDIECDIAMSSDEHHGFQHQPETIEFVKIMIEEAAELLTEGGNSSKYHGLLRDSLIYYKIRRMKYRRLLWPR